MPAVPMSSTSENPGTWRPWLLTIAAVGLVMSPLLAGIAPVGGDPDQMYRPIKSELARALRQGRLPFWSDRLGLGVPLLAESHAAALYPPNWVLYRFFDVDAAYRWSMGLHHLALAAAAYAYARVLGIGPWGSALTGVAASLCGFQASHAGHEPFYHVLPYLLAVLAVAEVYLAGGRLIWLPVLALLFGAELTLGHYQLQAWTAGLVLFTALWRVARDHRPPGRLLGLILALCWAGAIAAVPLAASGELRAVARPTERIAAEYTFYSYPPAHWAELVVPRLYQSFLDGPEDRYWVDQQTSPREACLYVGTVPLILAFVGSSARDRRLALWRWLALLGFALATMPRWWPEGYTALFRVPILGEFRAPARYTLLTSLALCLLAGRGLDRSIQPAAFRRSVALVVIFALLGAMWAVASALRPEFRSRAYPSSLPPALILAALAWTAGLAAVLAWRNGRAGAGLLVVLTAVELGLLFYSGATAWGGPIDLASASPVLRRLSAEPDHPVRVAGYLRDVPVLGGVVPAVPYLGFRHLPPHPWLEVAQTREWAARRASARRLRRYGVTHGAWDSPFDRYLRRDSTPVRAATAAPGVAFGPVLHEGPDPALERLVPGARGDQRWTVIRDPGAAPVARVAITVREVQSVSDLLRAIDASDSLDETWFLSRDAPRRLPGPRARSGRVLRWDGRSGEVACDGACLLVLTRTYYPGWTARVDGGPERPVSRVEGGLQAIPLDRPGVHRVSVRHRPTYVVPAACISLAAVATAAAAVFWLSKR